MQMRKCRKMGTTIKKVEFTFHSNQIPAHFEYKSTQILTYLIGIDPNRIHSNSYFITKIPIKVFLHMLGMLAYGNKILEI